MSKAPLGPTCWDCGAQNDPGSSECWLCQRRDWDRHADLRARRSEPEPPEVDPPWATGGWMVLIAVVAVGIGIFREYPGAALLLLISVAPALFITELKAGRRRRRGDRMPIVDRIAQVVLLMIVIPILAVLALVIAILVICSAH